MHAWLGKHIRVIRSIYRHACIDTGTLVPMTTWQKYVATITGDATQTAIAERTEIAQTTIGRWLNGTKAPTEAAKVAAFAQSYDRNPLEAFVAAGMLTVDQAGRGLEAHSVKLLESLVDELAPRRQKIGKPQGKAARKPPTT